ncbi:MAG: hypothetical protein ACF8QF_13000 [Phycisphaerales bacterium]
MSDFHLSLQDDPPPKKDKKEGCIVSVGQMCLLLGVIALLLT